MIQINKNYTILFELSKADSWAWSPYSWLWFPTIKVDTKALP